MRSITSLTEGNAARGRMMDLLKAKQPEMFGNLDLEKLKNSELLGILDKVNKSYKDRIELATYKTQKSAYGSELAQLYDMQNTARAALADPSILTAQAATKLFMSNVPYERPLFGHGKEELTDFINKSQQMIDVDQGKLADVTQRESLATMQQSIMGLAKIVYHQEATPDWWKAADKEKAVKEIAWFTSVSKQSGWLKQVTGHDMTAINGLLNNPGSPSAANGAVAGLTGGSLEGADASSKAITGGGRKQIIINVNREMIAGGITINAKEVKEGFNDMQRQVEEVLLRILNSANAVTD